MSGFNQDQARLLLPSIEGLQKPIKLGESESKNNLFKPAALIALVGALATGAFTQREALADLFKDDQSALANTSNH